MRPRLDEKTDLAAQTKLFCSTGWINIDRLRCTCRGCHMQRVLSKCGIPILVFVAIGMSVIGLWAERESASAQQPSPFAIGPTPPSELNPTGGGPAQATLQQAA